MFRLEDLIATSKCYNWLICVSDGAEIHVYQGEQKVPYEYKVAFISEWNVSRLPNVEGNILFVWI